MKFRIPNTFIRWLTKTDNRIVLTDEDLFTTIKTKYGHTFYFDKMVRTIEEVEHDYFTDDIKSTDVVLDIGACIGAFTLKASKRAKKVYALEPVITNQLKKNLKLNSIINVEVLDYALGTGWKKLSWGKTTRMVRCKSLSEIIKETGKIDFLKCDCEGGEWSIKPEELKNIRRLEIEVHLFKKEWTKDNFANILDKAGFNFNYQEGKESPELGIFSAVNRTLK